MLLLTSIVLLTFKQTKVMKKFTMLASSVLLAMGLLTTSCSNDSVNKDDEEKFMEVKDFSFVGKLHNAAMTAVTSNEFMRDNTYTKKEKEEKIDALLKITEKELERITGDEHNLNRYRSFYDPDKMNVTLFSKKTLFGETRVNKSTTDLANSPEIDLDALSCLYDVIDELSIEGFLSDKAKSMCLDIMQLSEQGFSDNLSNLELKTGITSLINSFNEAKFVKSSAEGTVLASTLSVSDSSYEWWDENLNDNTSTQNIAPWVAADITGGLLAGVFHVVRNWKEIKQDKINLREATIDVAEGALTGSLVGRWPGTKTIKK